LRAKTAWLAAWRHELHCWHARRGKPHELNGLLMFGIEARSAQGAGYLEMRPATLRLRWVVI